jgi:RNA polymerase sigma factor (sigma-70 family)
MRFIAAQGSTCLSSSESHRPSSLYALFVISGGVQVVRSMSADDWTTPEEFARRVRETLLRGDERCEALIDWCWANRQKFDRIAKAYRLDNKQDREDVFQTFVGIQLAKAWKAFWAKERTGDVIRGFHDYLIRAYINAVRRARRLVWVEEKRFLNAHTILRAVEDLADVAEGEGDGVAGRTPLVETFAGSDTTAVEADGQELENILQFLNELTPTEREVCTLLFVERLPVHETARRLGKTSSCVSAHKSHAKQKLGWLANQHFYHVTPDDIVDVLAFVGRIDSEPGFLKRVRDALPEDCRPAVVAVLNGAGVPADVAAIVDAINAHVLDVPDFCQPDDHSAVFGEIAVEKIEELPAWQHVRITRLVLDYFLRGTMLPARNKVIL